MLAAVLVTEFVYVFIGSAGKLQRFWPIYMDYYDQLADAFRAGHLHLLTRPAPELLAAPDPFSHAVSQYWLRDASFYHGKYYLYWGPVPALLQAAAKALLNIHRTIGDQYLTFVFSSCTLISGTVIICRMRQRLCRAVPLWLLPLSVLAFGLANPVTFQISSGCVYQAAITGSQAFLCLGLVFAFNAIFESNHRPAQGGPLVIAGTAWALAFGCRLSVLLAVAPLVLCTAACLSLTGSNRLQRFIWSGLRMGLPILAVACLLMVYNRLRFDDWLDTGIDRQLIFSPFRQATEDVAPNLDSYLLRMPDIRREFPYVFATNRHGAGVLSAWFPPPRGYVVSEPTVGMLFAVPLAYAVPIALLSSLRKLGRGLFESANSFNSVESHRRRVFLWLVTSLLIASIGAAILTLRIYLASMRYMGDFTNGIVLLGILGTFIWIEEAQHGNGHRRVCGLVVTALATWTIACGILLGYQGYNKHFASFNPDLHDRIVHSLSF